MKQTDDERLLARVEKWIKDNGLEVEVRREAGECWRCMIVDTAIKDGAIKAVKAGFGISPVAAIHDYAQKIVGKVLVMKAEHGKRRELQVPDWAKDAELQHSILMDNGGTIQVPDDYSPRNETEQAIVDECEDLAQFLIKKNRAYGNSAFDPIRIFSKADAREQILVRLDDKLSRMARGQAAGEDTPRDAQGYLTLARVFDRLEAARGRSA